LDPSKPAANWHTAWRALRDAAGLPGLRFHDLRHAVVTRLLEAGEPDHVVESITGHLSRRNARALLAHSTDRQEQERSHNEEDGTDVAGDIVLVRSAPCDVPRIIALSNATHRRNGPGLWWAAGYNIVAIPLAAGVLARWAMVLPAGAIDVAEEGACKPYDSWA
jgi:hypothetical protein